MRRYIKYVKPYLSAFILGPLMMITEVLGEVLLPFFMSKIVNEGAATHNISYMIQMGIVMLDRKSVV